MPDFGSAKSYSSVSEPGSGCDLCCEECVDRLWFEISGCLNFSFPLVKTSGGPGGGSIWVPEVPPASPFPGIPGLSGFEFDDGCGSRWFGATAQCSPVEGSDPPEAEWTVTFGVNVRGGATAGGVLIRRTSILCPPLDIEGDVTAFNNLEGPGPSEDCDADHPTLSNCGFPNFDAHVSLTT